MVVTFNLGQLPCLDFADSRFTCRINDLSGRGEVGNRISGEPVPRFEQVSFFVGLIECDLPEDLRANYC